MLPSVENNVTGLPMIHSPSPSSRRISSGLVSVQVSILGVIVFLSALTQQSIDGVIDDCSMKYLPDISIDISHCSKGFALQRSPFLELEII